MRNYGIYRLAATSPVQSPMEPVTAAEMAHFLRLPVPLDAATQALLESMVSAAREVAEVFQGRDLVAKQYDLWLDDFSTDEIELRDPLASVDLFTYKDSAGATTAMTANADYIVDSVRSLVMPPYGQSWPSFTPWPTSAVLIRHTTSPASVDAAVLNGIRYLVAGWWEGRLPFVVGDQVQEMPFAVREVFSLGKRWRFA